MALNLGAISLTALYLGSTAISTAYLGSVQVYAAGGAFTPASLFASGEEGAWYEPSTTTAFRSTTDLTPCGYGQSAGFLLDLSKGAGYSGGSFTGLGSELVTNGTFDTDTDWSKGASWAILGGVAFCASGAATALTQASTTSAGTPYLFECDYTHSGGTGVIARFGADTIVQMTTTKTYSVIVYPSTDNSTLSFTNFANTTATIDNISVRELPGNHATQGTEAARPILARVPETGRRNLLERTEEFDDAAWVAGRVSFSTPAITPPSGLSGAVYKISDTTDNNTHVVFQAGAGLVTAETWTASCYIKDAGEGVFFQLRPWGLGAGVAFATFDPSDGSLTESGGTALVGTPVATSVGDGWYRVEMTCSADIVDSNDGIAFVLSNSGTGGEYPSYVGDGSGLYIFGAQLEAASSATAYQKVVDQYDITEAGVTSLEYLAFDGSDDFMATASIDFTATDKMSVFAGVENEKDIAARGEFVAHNRTGNGITCAMPANNGSADFSITSKGTILREAGVANNAIYDQPFLCALTATMDISGDSIILRVNGAQIASNNGDQGAGNYANASLLVGNGGGLPFTGKIFSLIVRGAASTAQEISDTESYVANLTGVTL